MITLTSENFVSRVHCPACNEQLYVELGATCYQRAYEFPRGIVRLDDSVKKQKLLVRCMGCGVLYNRVIPKQETLDFLYNVPGRENVWKFNTDGRRMNEKLALLTALKSEKTLRVLDVGCYTGEFLSMLPEHWIKHGADPNGAALEVARRRIPSGHFLSGRLQDLAISGDVGSYDLISLWDVAEHLDDADSAFRKITSLLAPGGLLVLETGDTNSKVAKAMREGWYYVNYLEHFTFFNEESFRRLLPRYGLQISSCTTTIHHYPKISTLSAQFRFWAYFAMTIAGRTSKPWLALSELLHREGASYPPISRDHILITAVKTPGAAVSPVINLAFPQLGSSGKALQNDAKSRSL